MARATVGGAGGPGARIGAPTVVRPIFLLQRRPHIYDPCACNATQLMYVTQYVRRAPRLCIYYGRSLAFLFLFFCSSHARRHQTPLVREQVTTRLHAGPPPPIPPYVYSSTDRQTDRQTDSSTPTTRYTPGRVFPMGHGALHSRHMSMDVPILPSSIAHLRAS